MRKLKVNSKYVLLVIHGFLISFYDYAKIWLNLTLAEQVLNRLTKCVIQ